MNIIADTHTHTIASTHAYSTILENAKFASENGVKYLAMTDHGPAMVDAPHIWHFLNSDSIPDYLYGVRILRGVEANIRQGGSLDMTDDELEYLEWVVVSIHPPTFPETTLEATTQAYCIAAANPHVDVIGHSGLVNYPYDYEKAIKVFAEYDKLVEINNHSFEARADGIKNCVTIAKLCKKYRVRVVANSDAHFAYQVGGAESSLKLLKEIDFPQELILNTNEVRFEGYLAERKKRLANKGLMLKANTP